MTDKQSRIHRLISKHLNVDSIQELPYSLQRFVQACQWFIEDLLNQREKIQHSLAMVSTELEAQDRKIQEYEKKIESLLMDALPKSLIQRLMAGEKPVADAYPHGIVVIIHLHQFKRVTERVGAGQLVEFLNRVFSQFDQLILPYNFQKVKIHGPSYWLMSTDPTLESSAMQAVQACYELFDYCHGQFSGHFKDVGFQSGIHAGPVTVGVMGNRMLQYDIWGPTVDVAIQLAGHHSPHNSIYITRTLYDLLNSDYQSLFHQHESNCLINRQRIMAYALNLTDQHNARVKQSHPWHDFLQMRHYL